MEKPDRSARELVKNVKSGEVKIADLGTGEVERFAVSHLMIKHFFPMLEKFLKEGGVPVFSAKENVFIESAAHYKKYVDDVFRKEYREKVLELFKEYNEKDENNRTDEEQMIAAFIKNILDEKENPNKATPFVFGEDAVIFFTKGVDLLVRIFYEKNGRLPNQVETLALIDDPSIKVFMALLMSFDKVVSTKIVEVLSGIKGFDFQRDIHRMRLESKYLKDVNGNFSISTFRRELVPVFINILKKYYKDEDYKRLGCPALYDAELFEDFLKVLREEIKKQYLANPDKIQP